MPRITDDDKGAAVNLATWISLIIMCLVVLVKVFSKLFRIHETINIRNLQSDDYFISVALVAALGEAIAVAQQVPAGIGQNSSTLSNDQLNVFQKASYASQFLYIGAVGMAKFAALSFFLNVTTTPSHRLAVFGTMSVTGIWILVAWICIAAQCSLSAAKWDILSDKCFDQKVFWAGIEAINIMIDFALVSLPLFVLFKLQTSRAKKVAILIAFASRIIVTPAIIVRLVYISRSFRPMVDRVYAEWLVAVTTQVAMNVSIIVACVPFLKPLMDHLQPGWSTSNVRTGLGFNTIATRGGTTTSAQDGYGYTMGSVVKSSNYRVYIPHQQERESHDSLKRGV